MLRAWQHFDTFKGQASLRTWLYRIATNACLDALKKRLPRTLPVVVSPAADPLLPLAPAWAESTWLEPYPDSWLAEATEDPAARYSRRESVSLAFLTVLQLLPPRQRAILILSDVLDWRASEIASLLSISVSAVNSALHRARVTMAKQYHTDEQERGEGLECGCRDAGAAGALSACMGDRGCRGTGGAYERRRNLYYAAVSFLVSGTRSDSDSTHHSSLCASGAEPVALLPHKSQWMPGICCLSRYWLGRYLSGLRDSSCHPG